MLVSRILQSLKLSSDFGLSTNPIYSLTLTVYSTAFSGPDGPPPTFWPSIRHFFMVILSFFKIYFTYHLRYFLLFFAYFLVSFSLSKYSSSLSCLKSNLRILLILGSHDKVSFFLYFLTWLYVILQSFLCVLSLLS